MDRKDVRSHTNTLFVDGTICRRNTFLRHAACPARVPRHATRQSAVQRHGLDFPVPMDGIEASTWHYARQGWPHLPNNTVQNGVPADFPHSVVRGHPLLRLW